MEKSNYKAAIKITFYLLNIIVLILLLLPALAVNINIWWLDNLINLQLQISVLALAVIVINFVISFVYSKRYKVVLSALYCWLVAINIIPLYFNESLATSIGDKATSFTVAQLNLSYNNPNLTQLLPILGDRHFDLLVLQEVSDEQHINIKQLAKHYPYSFGLNAQEATPSGLAMFSRNPITEKHIHDLGYKSGQLLEAIIQMPHSTSPIQVFALHPSSPRSEILWQRRNETFSILAEKASVSPFINKIMIGDFNSSPWSSAFKNLQQNSQLKNSANGFGYLPSWSYSAKPLFSILTSAYIDHSLISPSFNVLNKYSQLIQGSDHRLVITELIVNN